MANPNPAAALLNQPPPTATRKSVTGFVTKLVGDGATYGFINDEIFFQQTNVADGPAGVNDRVLADCEYSEHLPIKWNATSIKILNRASSSPAAPGGQQPAPNPACNILESDPRRQSRQGMLMSQQQQQQQQQQAPPAPVPQMQQVAPPAFAPAVPTTVANSYQQHRQQKQQQQHLQHDVNMHQQQQPPPQQMQPQLPMGMMDPSMNRAPDFFSPFNQPPPQAMPQHPIELQPFGQHDSPMGPPKLEYTSQLGSAFVQNQFIPGPMLPQQPPQPMLPQQLPQQQQQQQQQRPPHHQNQQNQRNQNMNNNNSNNNSNNNKGRFNDNNKNNDRNQMNRGRNRNDKFEQSRVGERENSNSRQSRNSRERSSGRIDGPNNKSGGGNNNSSKRDNSNGRQSPQSHTARSTASISSDRGHNKSSSSSSSSKRYEPHNIPKSAILHNMNSWNMRSRCSSAIHVPSDLKNVIVNQYLRLDVKNTPKPLKFKIESSESEDKKENETDETTTKKIDVATGDDDQGGIKKVEAPASDSGASEESSQAQVGKKDSDQYSTPPSSKSDTRLNHKYGVKVVLISLPELEDIYKKVFGPELNSYTTDTKSHPRLDEAIEMLCYRGPNGGHSLIGGKFDPTIDGFMEGEVNEFERHGRQPDLIATCKRVVSEQTGLDLGPCQGWTLVSTFIYNNKSDYFSPKASIEYSYIYMPHIWTLSDFNLDDSLMEKESLMVNVSSAPQNLDVTMTEENEAGADTAAPAEASQADSVKEEVSATSTSTTTIEPEVAITTATTSIDITPVHEPGLTVENLGELKVADLKAELDKRGVVYKPSLKKADLVALLQANLSSTSQNTESSAATIDTKEPDAAPPAGGGGEIDSADQLEEGEVATEEDTPDQSEENTRDASDAQAAMAAGKPGVELAGTLKRKVDEVAGGSGDQQEENEATNNKKIKEDMDEGASESCKKGSEKVDLIKEPFVVRARKGQQLATVSLYDAAQVLRYDQFELSVASHILKEALIQHLSEYIFTSLVEENRSKPQASAGCDTSSTTSSSTGTTNSQEINNSTSDTNNNNSSKNAKSDKQEEGQVAKEYPVDRYITLAFSYFDSTHKGYLHADDLSKLLHNTGITISKRALMSLLCDSDKFNYRTLADLSPVKFAPTYVYKFPEQFNRLPSSSMSDDDNQQTSDQQSAAASRTVEYQGVRYEVEKLIQQVREAETMRVNMVERFNHAIENFDKQADEIHVLEVSRMSLSKSIKSINDELSEVRRSRDVAEKKLDSLKAKLEAMLTEIQ